MLEIAHVNTGGRRPGAAALRMLRRWLSDFAPIVVGGTGGSGTRVVQAVLTRAGAFMGVRLNASGDAMDFEPFLDDNINRVLAVTRSLDYCFADLPGPLRRELLAGFDGIVARYRLDLPLGMRWGWKNPRSMFVMPLIHARFPQMTFVHVLRDGRDMALSENRNQLRKHYAALFGEPATECDRRAALRLWAGSNLAVAAWGERVLGDRYVRLRFEDLCAEPAAACATLARRLGLPIDAGELLASSISPPATLGRWRSGEDPPGAALSAAAETALAAYGYL